MSEGTLEYYDAKDSNTVTISVEEYESLIDQSKFLQCLQDAGVDNWEGYDIAMDMMDDVDA